MRQLQKYLIFVLLIMMAAACTPSAANPEVETAASTATSQPQADTALMIRIHNNSSRDFDSVEVQFPGQTEQYGMIAAGSSSDYRAVGEAYSYAYVKVTAGGDEFVLQPIDYVGESLLAPGEYTYVLDVAEQQLLLTLVEGDEALPPTPPEESVAVPPTNTAVSPTDTVAPTEAPAADLNGTSWRLVAYGAPDRAEAVLSGTEITADFLDGQLTGSAGCNQYFATYEQSGSALTTGAVASTRIGCTPEVNEQELRVLQGLETAVSFEVSNDTLTIQHENGVLVFAAAAPAQPETAVVDSLESILILSPGPGSAVTSPVVISGEADYVFEASLAVEIRAIEAAEPVGVGFAMLNVSEIGQRGPFSGEVAFTAPAEATPGRISVFTISARDGHIEHLASVPVTLLPAGGAANITTAEPHPEAIAIHTPEHLARLAGGSAHVTGYAAPTFEQNLVIEVLDGEGMVVGQGATIIASGMGQWGPFAADVSYSVAAETPGALCLTDYSPADGNMVHRTCLNVTLAP